MLTGKFLRCLEVVEDGLKKGSAAVALISFLNSKIENLNSPLDRSSSVPNLPIGVGFMYILWFLNMLRTVSLRPSSTL